MSDPTKGLSAADIAALESAGLASDQAALALRQFPPGNGQACHGRQRTPRFHPVPMAFMPASFAAKRAA